MVPLTVEYRSSERNNPLLLELRHHAQNWRNVAFVGLFPDAIECPEKDSAEDLLTWRANKTKGFHRCFQDAVTSKFGADAIEKPSNSFKIENKHVVEEAQNIGPLQSDRFLSIYELRDFLCGSKIAFERSPTCLIMGYCASIYHTDILFTRRDGGEPDVVELALDSKWKVAPTLRVSPVLEMVKWSPTVRCVDNRYLKDVGTRRGEVDLRRNIYRLIGLEGLPISYSCGRLNCDHLATFLLSGEPIWTTKQYEASLATWISVWDMFKGVVDKPFLLALEEETSQF